MYEVSISRGMEKTYPEYPRNHQNDCTEVAAMPAAMPTAIAIPPITTILMAFFICRRPEILARTTPRTKSAARENTIETQNADPSGSKAYGKSGIIPEQKYETNIRRPFAIEFDGDTSFFSKNSSADCSERKLPTAMENASTDTSTIPLIRMVFCGTPAIAMPERSPTVETKLSSTPNTKVRRKLARDSLSENAIRLTEITLSPLSSP